MANKKRDTVRKQFERVTKIYRDGGTRRLVSFAALDGTNGQFQTLASLPANIVAARREALSLSSKNANDESLRKAFAYAGLEPRNPRHWRILLDCFAEAHFGRRAGRPTKWSAINYDELLNQFDEQMARTPRLSVIAICKILKKAHYSGPGQPSWDALRKLVRNARNPKNNEFPTLRAAGELIEKNKLSTS